MITRLSKGFDHVAIERNPIEDNGQADCLSKMASNMELFTRGKVLLEYVHMPSYDRHIHEIMTDAEENWMMPFVSFLRDNKASTNPLL